MKKEFVPVIARHDKGIVTPIAILWKDGRTFKIDRVHGVRYWRSRVDNIDGSCYSVQIGKKITSLYEQGGQWFVEARE